MANDGEVTVGSGFGRTYRRDIHREETAEIRQEIVTTTVVDGNTVEIIVRDKIVPFDPYLNMVRAAAYQYMVPGPFPVPRVPRNIKDFLIRTNVSI